MARYIVIAPNMQWIRHWRREQYAAGNLDMISAENLLCFTGRHDIEKTNGIRPMEGDVVVKLGTPGGAGGGDVITALFHRGFDV